MNRNIPDDSTDVSKGRAKQHFLLGNNGLKIKLMRHGSLVTYAFQAHLKQNSKSVGGHHYEH